MIIEFPISRSVWYRFFRNALEALPLGIFLTSVKLLDPTVRAEWRGPYLLSALSAIAVTLIAVRGRRILNRIYFALALYFISGAVGLLVGWAWLNDFYGSTEATAMLIWIVAIGICAMGSRAGFIGVKSENRKAVRLRSIGLLAVALIVTGLSWRFHGDALLSAYVPFIILFIAQALCARGVPQSRSHAIVG